MCPPHQRILQPRGSRGGAQGLDQFLLVTRLGQRKYGASTARAGQFGPQRAGRQRRLDEGVVGLPRACGQAAVGHRLIHVGVNSGGNGGVVALVSVGGVAQDVDAGGNGQLVAQL